MRNYTQAELGRLAGLSQSAVASYETGERQSTRALLKLATVLQVEPQWLDTGKGTMERPMDGYPPAAPTSRHVLMEEGLTPLFPDNRKGAADWPFHGIARNRYETLTIRDKRHAENLLATFIEACQANYATAKIKSRRGT
jgi:transcriptional regulator with XRE-family HTH domain